MTYPTGEMRATVFTGPIVYDSNNIAVKEAVDRLVTAMNAVGVFPVKAGELESFFPGVGLHGPGYAVAVMDRYPNLDAVEYNEMREFVQSWGI